uniref:Cysteine proteinase inhibitor n=1 Tax=Oryza brachyantha TaxID=4533 RepID=J3LWY4_ORYBR
MAASATSLVLLLLLVAGGEAKQGGSGGAYYLQGGAREAHAGAGAGRPFDAVVVVKPWLKSKELVSFAPSPK